MATIAVAVIGLVSAPPTELTAVAWTTSEPTTTPEPTAQPTPDPTPRPTPTPDPACRDSHDRACGKFYWDPPPVNDPMTVDISFEPAEPKVGEDVVFTIVATDDSPSHTFVKSGTYDGIISFDSSASCGWDPRFERFGPWTPPEKTTQRRVIKETHPYREPGTYDVELRVAQSSCAIYDPYRSSATVRTTVVVKPSDA